MQVEEESSDESSEEEVGLLVSSSVGKADLLLRWKSSTPLALWNY